MRFIPTKIPEVILIELEVFKDARGIFMEMRHQKKFKERGIHLPFVQDNYSRSAQGVLRGLHYQVKQPQGKLIRVVKGEIFDVSVDMRKGSKTWGEWVSVRLSEDHPSLLWVPPGFAHGFYALSPEVHCLYSCTDFYAPAYERCLLWEDEHLAIPWPLQGKGPPILSDKDRYASSFADAESVVIAD